MENLQTAVKFDLFSNWLAQKFGVIKVSANLPGLSAR